MNLCKVPLNDYINCIKKYNSDFVRNTMCKNLLQNYNNCVLGKKEWAEEYEKNKNIENELVSSAKRAIDMPPYVN